MQHLRTSVTCAVAICCLLVPSQAHAIIHTFDFTVARNWTGGTLDYTSNLGSLDVTVNGQRGDGTTNDVSIGASSGFGLTVCTSAGATGISNDSNCDPDQHYIDNNNPGGGEEVKFTFAGGVEVTLLSMTASFWGSDDDFSLRVGGTVRGNDLDIGAGTGTITHDISSLGGDLTDNMFLIGARATDNDDEFALRRLVVDFAASPPAAVPEPSTILLFVSGLAGLGLWRRRKSKKT